MALFAKTKKSVEKQGVAEKKEKPVVKTRRSDLKSLISHQVLMRPAVTEKSGRGSVFGHYSFIVSKNATKHEIKRSVFETYGVRPLKVNVALMPIKKRRLGKSQGVVPGYKKAIVTLPEGKTIEVMPK